MNMCAFENLRSSKNKFGKLKPRRKGEHKRMPFLNCDIRPKRNTNTNTKFKNTLDTKYTEYKNRNTKMKNKDKNKNTKY